MKEKLLWDVRVTSVLFLFLLAVMFLSLSCDKALCDKKCQDGEVKFRGKCYVPGVSYLRANGTERMV